MIDLHIEPCGCCWDVGTWYGCARARDLRIEFCGGPSDPQLVECRCGACVDPLDFDWTAAKCKGCAAA